MNYRTYRVLLASDFDQLPKRFDDHGDVATGRLAVPSWKMAHAHLFDRHAKPGYLSEDFRVHHRAHRVDLNPVEDTAVENFESAINVTDPDPEHEPDEDIPTPCKQQSVGRVLSPGSVTSNDVVGIRLFEERAHFP